VFGSRTPYLPLFRTSGRLIRPQPSGADNRCSLARGSVDRGAIGFRQCRACREPAWQIGVGDERPTEGHQVDEALLNQPIAAFAVEPYVTHDIALVDLAKIEQGCAVAALASEVRRLGRDAQSHFARGLDEMIDTLAAAVAEQRPGNDQQTSREEAISFYCEMVGALLLSRAVGDADPSLANAILAAERRTLLAGAAETQD
jgi:hypothetical protein